MSNIATSRRTVFIKKAFQGRFILRVLLLILLSGFCSALLVYWLTGSDLHSQMQTAHVSIDRVTNRLGFSILIGHFIALAVTGALAIFIVLYASHKIAGPLYRFEMLCRQIGDGKLDIYVGLREGDQLQDLAQAFADMIDKLRSRQNLRDEHIATLTRSFRQLQNDLEQAGQHHELLIEIEQTIEQLRNG